MGAGGAAMEGWVQEGTAACPIWGIPLHPPRFYTSTGHRPHSTTVGPVTTAQWCTTWEFLVGRVVRSSMACQHLVVGFGDSISGFRGILVLPDANDSPG